MTEPVFQPRVGLLADSMLDNAALKDLLGKMYEDRGFGHPRLSGAHLQPKVFRAAVSLLSDGLGLKQTICGSAIRGAGGCLTTGAWRTRRRSARIG